MGASPFVSGESVPKCITLCLAKSVQSNNCTDDDQSCWCKGNTEESIINDLYSCHDADPNACASNLFDRMKASVQLICKQVSEAQHTSTLIVATPTPTAQGSSSATGSDSATLETTASNLFNSNNDSENNGGSGLSTGAAVGIGVGSGVAVILVLSLLLWWLKVRHRKRGQQNIVPPSQRISGQSTLRGSALSSTDSAIRHKYLQMETPVWRPGPEQQH